MILFNVVTVVGCSNFCSEIKNAVRFCNIMCYRNVVTVVTYLLYSFILNSKSDIIFMCFFILSYYILHIYVNIYIIIS